MLSAFLLQMQWYAKYAGMDTQKLVQLHLWLYSS